MRRRTKFSLLFIIWLLGAGLPAASLAAASLAATPAPLSSKLNAQKSALQQAQSAAQAHRQAAASAAAKSRDDATRAALLTEAQIQAAAQLRRLETQTGGAATTYANLQTQLQTATQALHDNEAALASLLPVMQRLASQPAATLLANPAPPEDSVRGLLILSGISAEIQRRTQAVQAQAQQAQQLLGQISQQQSVLLNAVAVQQNAENALSAQIAAARNAETADRDLAASETAAAIAANNNVHNLSGIITRLKSAQSAASPDFSALALGNASAPVAGSVLQNFGAPTVAGPAIGVTYRAAPAARVTAPCSGPVQFADPFQSYGLLVILDCGQNYLFVLSGMAHLDVSAGQKITRGQPIGEMSGLNAKNLGQQPHLYVELRQNGTPVNPALWRGTGGSG